LHPQTLQIPYLELNALIGVDLERPAASAVLRLPTRTRINIGTATALAGRSTSTCARYSCTLGGHERRVLGVTVVEIVGVVVVLLGFDELGVVV
jgi:hypothetical protein